MNLAKRSEYVRQQKKNISKRSEHVYIEEFKYRSEANRFDSNFVFKKTKKGELSFFQKTKGKKRKGSIVNYRSFAITTTDPLGLHFDPVCLHCKRSRQGTAPEFCIQNQIRIQLPKIMRIRIRNPGFNQDLTYAHWVKLYNIFHAHHSPKKPYGLASISPNPSRF